jgi:two-component system, OmpR family, alkaline phosphatase synthesis response regulator PhoP
MRNAEQNSSATILIVGDNRQDCELLVSYLTEEGYQIATVDDGQQAINAVARSKPDLILLDMRIRSVNGCDVCQKFKSNSETRYIPIVMLTPVVEVGDVKKAVTAGVNELLETPVRKLELTSRVQSLLRAR